MIGTVEESHPYVDHLTIRYDSFLHDINDALLNGRDESSWNHAADDSIDKLESRAPFQRLDLDVNVTKLTSTAGLLFVFVLDVRSNSFDGFFVRNFRFGKIHFDIVFFFKSFCYDQQMQFALACNNRLAQLSIHRNNECRILFVERMKTIRHSILVTLRSRMNCHPDDWVREHDRFEVDWKSFAGERIVGMGILEFHNGADVSGDNFADFTSHFAVHDEQLTKTFSFAV